MMSGGHGPESPPKLGDGFDDDPAVAEAIDVMYEFSRGRVVRADAEVLLELWWNVDSLTAKQQRAVLDRFPGISGSKVDPVGLATAAERYVINAGFDAQLGEHNTDAVMEATGALIRALTARPRRLPVPQVDDEERR